MKQYIIDENCTRNSTTMSQEEKDEWVEVPRQPVDTPLQDNNFDCGVFVCMYVDYWLQDLPESFSHKNIPMLRNKICYCILNKALLYTVYIYI